MRTEQEKENVKLEYSKKLNGLSCKRPSFIYLVIYSAHISYISSKRKTDIHGLNSFLSYLHKNYYSSKLFHSKGTKTEKKIFFYSWLFYFPR